MSGPLPFRTSLCALALAAACGGSVIAASPAAAGQGHPHRVKYLERRLELARRDLANARAKLVAHYEHKVAVKQRLVEESRICSHSLPEARAGDCQTHAAALVEGLQQELAQARENKLRRPWIAARERRIERLEKELAAAQLP